MSRTVLYHNPACSKSRGAHELLTERGVEFDVVEYLKAPLSREDLDRVLALISDAPENLVRKDKRFKELGLDPANYQTPARVAELLVDHPELMERPVVIKGDRGLIARPPDKLLELLDSEPSALS